MNYGYIRVSTDKQEIKRQEDALKSCNLDKVFCDKLSGSNCRRPELDRLRLEVRPGDSIYIESISRLGRNVDDLRRICEELKNKDITIHFLREALNTGGEMYKFILTILGAVAEMEREETVHRIRQGIRAAQERGTKSGRPIGRPPKQKPKHFDKYYPRWKAGDMSGVEFANLLKVSRSTLYRYIRDES